MAVRVPGVSVVETDDGRTLPAVAARAAETFGDRPFLLAVRDGAAHTFASFDALTDRIGAGLAGVVGPGEHVGMLVPTTGQGAVAVFAVLKAGAVPVLLPNQYDGDALATVIRSMLTGTRVIAPARWHHRLPPGLAPLDMDRLPTAPDRPRWRREPPSPASLAVVLPTSGTTGAPKGVLSPHGHGVHYAECTAAMRRLGPEDGIHGFAPLFHADGLFGNVVGALVTGARLALSWPPSIAGFWDTCRAARLTTFAYAGGLIAMLDAPPARGDDAANPVRVASGAPSPPARARPFERRFGLHLTEGYGSTEAGISLIAPWEGSRVEEASCGRAVCGYDVRLAGDGELLVRPHDATFVMLGYLGDRAATARRLPGDGWFHTGDVLAGIGDGHYVFRGRKDDVIRHRGEFVAPVLVEEAALAHGGVREAAAYGVPAQGGEPGEQEVALAVVARFDADQAGVEPASLTAHLRERLPAVAVPAVIHVLDDLPRSPGSGKVQKHLLPGAAPVLAAPRERP